MNFFFIRPEMGLEIKGRVKTIYDFNKPKFCEVRDTKQRLAGGLLVGSRLVASVAGITPKSAIIDFGTIKSPAKRIYSNEDGLAIYRCLTSPTNHTFRKVTNGVKTGKFCIVVSHSSEFPDVVFFARVIAKRQSLFYNIYETTGEMPSLRLDNSLSGSAVMSRNSGDILGIALGVTMNGKKASDEIVVIHQKDILRYLHLAKEMEN